MWAEQRNQAQLAGVLLSIPNIMSENPMHLLATPLTPFRHGHV